MKKCLELFFVFFLGSLAAQVPDTDLWLFKLEKNKQTGATLKSVGNITNRPGYDNQPSFSPDGRKIYYVSIREDKQADIYYYEVKSKKNIRLSTTGNESEYSPVLTEDGKFLSCVAVESDSAQRIHFINSLNGNYDRKFEFDSVGYCEFLSPDTVVYYKLTEPHSLWYYSHKTKEDRRLAVKPIRTFKALNRHTILYGTKDSTKVTFFQFDFFLGKATKYCEYPSTNEDVFWNDQLGLVKSEGTKLYRYHEKKKQWEMLFDLSAFGLKKITRFAFDRQYNYLVVVNNL